MENWLATLPPQSGVKLLVVGDGEAACFLGRRAFLRNRVVPTRGLFLNGTGHPDFDEICLEHNGWLARRGFSLRQLIDALPRGWDELFLDAVDRPFLDGGPRWPSRVVVRKSTACHFVNLEKVRAANNDYLSLLAGDMRSQIKRSIKLYEKRAPITLEEARDAAQARSIYDEMVALHQKTWTDRGEAGAFALPYLKKFHDRLIAERLAHGEIQLLRVRAGEATIGCLYNFVWNGVVSFYQSGVVYETDNKLKPGLVSHVEAVRQNAAGGRRVYDFLAGEARYKRSLATDSTEMVWATVQKPRLRFFVEDQARKLREKWRTRKVGDQA
jgi:hypothetical protein